MALDQAKQWFGFSVSIPTSLEILVGVLRVLDRLSTSTLSTDILKKKEKKNSR